MNTRNIENSLVGFIDLLGYSERVRNISSDEALEQLIEDIKHVQDTFEYKPNDESIKKSHKVSKTQILAFSDCIVLSLPFKSPLTKEQGSFDTFMLEITSLAYSQARCVLNNIFVRGALDLGFWFHEQDILISPPLVNAYQLEQNLVCYPVIALSESLWDFLNNHPHRAWYSPDADPIQRAFKHNTTHEGSYYYIDYIQINIDSVGWMANDQIVKAYKNAKSNEEKDSIHQEGYGLSCKLWLEQHKKAITSAMAGLKNEPVRKKYDWLVQYHNRFIDSCNGKFSECIISKREKISS